MERFHVRKRMLTLSNSCLMYVPSEITGYVPSSITGWSHWGTHYVCAHNCITCTLLLYICQNFDTFNGCLSLCFLCGNSPPLMCFVCLIVWPKIGLVGYVVPHNTCLRTYITLWRICTYVPYCCVLIFICT